MVDVLKVLGGEEELWRDMGMVLLRWGVSAHGQGAVGAGDKQGQWGLREQTRAQYRRCPEKSGLRRGNKASVLCCKNLGHAGTCPLLRLCPAVGEELSGGLRGNGRGEVAGTPNNSSVWHPQGRTGTSAPGTSPGSAAVTPRPGQWRR